LGAPETLTFVPVGVVNETRRQAAPLLAPPAEAEAPSQATSGDARACSIDIALANGARLSVDSFVNEKALARVLRAMKGAT
jgi:transposase